MRKIDKNKFIKYYNDNKTHKEIAKLMNVSKGVVEDRIKRFGLKRRGKGHLAIDLLNQKIGSWVVINKAPHPENTEKEGLYWLCRCICGVEKIIDGQSLRKKKSLSCGCVGRDYWFEAIGDITLHRWKRIKDRAEKANMEFSITIEFGWDLFLRQNRKCALSGVELKFSKRIRDFTNSTASLDRIDSSKGYVIGNVQWVHKDLNMMKHAYENNYFIEWCKKIAKYQESVF